MLRTSSSLDACDHTRSSLFLSPAIADGCRQRPQGFASGVYAGLTALVLVPVIGCEHLDKESAAQVPTPGMTHIERQVSSAELDVVAFLNLPRTTLEVLDLDVGLNRRAATSLVAHRDGSDGVFGTLDDDLFDSLDEVDAVPNVGDATINRLVTFVQDEPDALADPLLGVFLGVPFTVSEAAVTLEVANRADPRTLAQDVGLDIRAVRSITEVRPITSIGHLSNLYFIGAEGLKSLKDHAATMAETVGNSAFILTDDRVAYYTGLFFEQLRNDIVLYDGLVERAGSDAAAERFMVWIEVEFEGALLERVGQTFASEHGLIRELSETLDRLKHEAIVRSESA